MNLSALIPDFGMAAALLITVSGALLLLAAEAWLKEFPHGPLAGLVLLMAAGAGIWHDAGRPSGAVGFHGAIYGDRLTGIVQLMILAGTLMAVAAGAARLRTERVESPGEYHALLLFSCAGALLFVSAAEFITLLLGLELMSLPLYCLCGSAVSRRDSSESALKYFILGAFSSAFLLYGAALAFGLSGATSIAALAAALKPGLEAPALMALGLMLVGLGFKMAAFPFHFWAPDVYQGAPTPVVIYMAAAVKTAAVVVAARVLWLGFGALLPAWSGALWSIAVLSMTAGNLLALRQTSLKRMLAFSSIAHAGYLLTAFLARGSWAAVVFYLAGYMAAVIGALGVVLGITAHCSGRAEADSIARLRGLAKDRPAVAAAMALFMLSLAGLPPGLAGLLGKFYVFGAAIKAGCAGLVVIAVLNSALACAYYLRVIMAMYFQEAEPGMRPRAVRLGRSLTAVLAISAAAALLIGLFPGWIYDALAGMAG